MNVAPGRRPPNSDRRMRRAGLRHGEAPKSGHWGADFLCRLPDLVGAGLNPPVRKRQPWQGRVCPYANAGLGRGGFETRPCHRRRIRHEESAGPRSNRDMSDRNNALTSCMTRPIIWTLRTEHHRIPSTATVHYRPPRSISVPTSFVLRTKSPFHRRNSRFLPEQGIDAANILICHAIKPLRRPKRSKFGGILKIPRNCPGP
jgi:hypothetical protein